MLFRSVQSIIRLAFSSNPKKPLLELFSSPDCTLCLHFKRQLSPYLKANDFHLIEIDITKPDNEKYFDQYKYDIPVLHVDGEFHQKHRFRAEVFEAKLRQISSGHNIK